MRKSKYLALLAAFALALCMNALAQDNSGKFNLEQTAKIGSTVLQPGHYTAEWTGPKDALKINIRQGSKTVATAEGSIKELPNKSPYDAVSMKTQSDNSKKVDEIDFRHRSEALLIHGM